VRRWNRHSGPCGANLITGRRPSFSRDRRHRTSGGSHQAANDPADQKLARPVKLPSSYTASVKLIEMPTPTLAARPTSDRKVPAKVRKATRELRDGVRHGRLQFVVLEPKRRCRWDDLRWRSPLNTSLRQIVHDLDCQQYSWTIRTGQHSLGPKIHGSAIAPIHVEGHRRVITDDSPSPDCLPKTHRGAVPHVLLFGTLPPPAFLLTRLPNRRPRQD
jgi:hypothetical protein